MPATSSRLCSLAESWWTLTSITRSPRDPHGGGRAPDREAEEEVGHHDCDDAGPDRPARCPTDAGGPAGGGVAVVAVDEDHRDREEEQLEERPQHVDRWQELQEVMVVGAGGLSVDV